MVAAAVAGAMATVVLDVVTALIPIDPKGAQEKKVDDRQKMLAPDKGFHRALDRRKAVL